MRQKVSIISDESAFLAGNFQFDLFIKIFRINYLGNYFFLERQCSNFLQYNVRFELPFSFLEWRGSSPLCSALFRKIEASIWGFVTDNLDLGKDLFDDPVQKMSLLSNGTKMFLPAS